ncbi:VOC family protein [Marinicella sp. W31]|uniref:VOC family protein n=1 Tax=Marinicella sp. W31 TaxID=3023713 RepID=UPI00375693A6
MNNQTSTKDKINEFTEINSRVFCGSNLPILHHVCLFVPDVDKSVDFYTNVIGLTVREEFEDIIGFTASRKFPFDVSSVFLEAGDGRYIELHPAGNMEMSLPQLPLNHFAFAVKDVVATYEKSIAFGCNPFGFEMKSNYWDGKPLDVVMTGSRPEPMRMAFFQGPSGELIELYQSIDEVTYK